MVRKGFLNDQCKRGIKDASSGQQVRGAKAVVKGAVLNMNLQRNPAGRDASIKLGKRSFKDKLSLAQKLKLEVFFS